MIHHGTVLRPVNTTVKRCMSHVPSGQDAAERVAARVAQARSLEPLPTRTRSGPVLKEQGDVTHEARHAWHHDGGGSATCATTDVWVDGPRVAACSRWRTCTAWLKEQAYGTHEALHAWHHGSPRCQLLRGRLGNNLCDNRRTGLRSQGDGVLAVADLHGSAWMRLGIDATVAGRLAMNAARRAWPLLAGRGHRQLVRAGTQC